MKIKQIYKLYTTVPLLFSFLLLLLFMIFFCIFEIQRGVANPHYPAGSASGWSNAEKSNGVVNCTVMLV